jgi:nucleotide-binding universal stress UspA family protein
MSQRCDLLVVGTDKTGIFKAVLLGSLGMRLAAAAKCSVAVIPGQATTGLDVVVGVDGTPESLLACEFAASEADACGGELIVLCAGYVANPLFADLVPPVLPGRERAALLARASEHVHGLFPALSVQTRLVDGPPPRALLEEAHGAGLLVIGHHKRAKVIRRFERSVGRDVLMDMSVPVVVVHDKESNV